MNHTSHMHNHKSYTNMRAYKLHTHKKLTCLSGCAHARHNHTHDILRVTMSLSDAHYFEEMGVKKYEEIRVLLDSREKKDKLEGMKRLIAMISIGEYVCMYIYIYICIYIYIYIDQI